VRLESVNGVGVAVQRTVRVTADGSALGLDSGFASSTGTSVAATRWVTPWADRSAEGTSTLSIANPSVDTIAEVEVRTFAAGAEAKGDAVKKVELGPGRGTSIDLGATGGEARGLIVTSNSPVVVERRALGASGDDLAVIGAVPSADDLDPLPSMSHTAAAGGSGG